MGLFSLVGSIFGGNAAKKASRRAEQAQIAAMDRAIGEQRRQFDVTRADYEPARALLAPSIESLSGLIGLSGPEAQQLALNGIQASPELMQIIRNGEDALLANASATGGLRGGNTQDALARFRGDAFANQIGTQLQRLGGLAGLGMGATDSVSAFGANASNNISQQMVGQGAARAQGLLTRGGINSQMWNNVGGFLDQAFSAAVPGATPAGLFKRAGQMF
jgi:hypothetical protein